MAKDTTTFLLKLTEQQRDALIHATRLKGAVKRKFEQAGEGTQTVPISRAELDHLNEELSEAAVFAPSPHKQRIVAVQRKVAALVEPAEAVPDGTEARRPASPADVLFQFKITLLEIDPPIWRRVQVADCTLDLLHEYIQAAFGWENCHLHEFHIDGVRYGPREHDDLDFDMETEDEAEATLSQLLPKSRRKVRWVYEYDFGDGWRHEILFEGYPPRQTGWKYPICTEGARACPPEDCGGPWGYADYLAAVADPEHEQHEEMLGWRGPFDPEAFDPKAATREMKKVR